MALKSTTFGPEVCFYCISLSPEASLLTQTPLLLSGTRLSGQKGNCQGRGGTPALGHVYLATG